MMKMIVPIVSLLVLLQCEPVYAQITCGKDRYCNHTEKEYQEPVNRSQQERLNDHELGGPVGSGSDYVYGTRDRQYEHDDGGPGSDYSRDDYYTPED